MKRMLTIVAVTAAVLFWSSGAARATDRYSRGRTLYFRRCGPCFSMGWKWNPSPIRTKNLNLFALARKWSPAKVCTWMRTSTKHLTPPGCYPGRIRYRNKVDILYYIMRASQGPIRRPRMEALWPGRLKPIRFKRLLPSKLATARKRLKNLLELRRLRWHSPIKKGKWSGSTTPPTSAGSKSNASDRRPVKR
ncbi:MAG: hypothetical protein J7M25_05685 [Deltaproteobacteria bacterium]|nr:hypothetical protein [Deltaproteobacteria bacterium]